MEKLVNKAKHGDKNALVALIIAEKESFYKLAYVYMKNSEDAMDVMEDMIVILHEKINSLKDDSAFYRWSKTILVNCCKRHLKKKKRNISLDDVKEGISSDSVQNVDDAILLDNHLSLLSQKQQEVIKMRYFLDMDYKTISEIINVPVGTVKSRLSIGLKKLRESLGDDYNE